MTLNQAISKACESAKRNNEERFVVRSSEPDGLYHVASAEDLETFFVGISDRDILYSTADLEEVNSNG